MTAFDPSRKILGRDAAVRWREAHAGRVVFTNGVFDLMHAGHVDLLRSARERGEALIVAINSDDSTRRLKGASRPVRPQADRAYLLAALEAVDAVVIFDEDTPRELLSALHPDVIVKGGDYTVDNVVGAAEVVARGGEVVIIPLTPGRSTTGTIEQIRDGGVDGSA